MLSRRIGSLAFCVLLGISRFACGHGEPAFTDPAKAGPDYDVQGEYQGELHPGAAEAQKVGIQVVALGDHQFDATIYFGGLPGDGWRKRATRAPAAKARPPAIRRKLAAIKARPRSKTA